MPFNRRTQQTMKSKTNPIENLTPRLVITADEAAQALGVSKKTVYRLCSRGLLKKAYGIRHLRILRQSIEDFCNKAQ